MKAYERFLNYVAFPTMSDETSPTCPSTKKQLALLKALCEELTALGIPDAHVDEFGYLYATIPANTDQPVQTIGFLAHVDTSSAASDENVKARIVEYTGGDIVLHEEKGIVLRACDYPYLERFVGQHLIVTDGTTLLGADDKAGVAEIVSAVERILDSDIPHGEIRIAFTPDEEIGRGTDHFDVAKFHADYAYTVDGGALGELEYENFNAGDAYVTIHGISIHPGDAKDKMINAALLACEFSAMLPKDEIPERTEGYEGFYHLCSLEGETELATLRYILRDHDAKRYSEKKRRMQKVADALNQKYGEGTVELRLTDSYRNMREKILEHPYILERAKRAMERVGVTPHIVPIRGGTDGARLSFMGLPCPNLCTGGVNFHSRFECISAEHMEKVTDILVAIIEDSVIAAD